MIFFRKLRISFFLFLSVELSEFLSPNLEPLFCCLYFGCQTIPIKHYKTMVYRSLLLKTFPLDPTFPCAKLSGADKIRSISSRARCFLVQRLVGLDIVLADFWPDFMDSCPFRHMNHMNFCMPVFQEPGQMTPSSDWQHEQQQKQLARCRWSAFHIVLLFRCSKECTKTVSAHTLS